MTTKLAGYGFIPQSVALGSFLMKMMTPQKLFDEYATLPVEAQRQVADFIAFLQQRYTVGNGPQKARQNDLRGEPFIGIWRDRQDLSDSSGWVRKTRKLEWGDNT